MQFGLWVGLWNIMVWESNCCPWDVRVLEWNLQATVHFLLLVNLLDGFLFNSNSNS